MCILRYFRTYGVIGCGKGARMLLYGWDRDALPFRLLDGLLLCLQLLLTIVGFVLDIGIVVGKNTPYKYLVVNIHFVPIVKHDYSGNQLLMSRKRFVSICLINRNRNVSSRRKYLAGVMSGGAEVFSLTPHTFSQYAWCDFQIDLILSLIDIKTPFSCQYQGPKLTMFALGVHAHRWGLYRVPIVLFIFFQNFVNY